MVFAVTYLSLIAEFQYNTDTGYHSPQAFLVAWFDMLFQSARIVGLCSIGSQLRKLGWRRAEMGTFLTGVLGLIGDWLFENAYVVCETKFVFQVRS